MQEKDRELLKSLCAVQAPSGSEYVMKDYLLNYIHQNKGQWKYNCDIYEGEAFQDCIILSFGEARTAIFAHMDSVGYTVGYDNELIKIGGPKAKEGSLLVGADHVGAIEGKLDYIIDEEADDKKIIKTIIDYPRTIDRATTLTYKANTRFENNYVISNYLDNRLGMWNALKVAEDLKDGVIVFSTWEEVGGGSVGFLSRFIYQKWNIQQALISDITWVTEGVTHGEGVAISMRDSAIPRRTFLNKIVKLAKESNIAFQIEVESSGGSDGNAIQKSPYPIDWCFIGAPEDGVHTPDEKVHLEDAENMVKLYKYLMKEL